MGVVAALALSSCDSYLDSENYTEANTGNFPAQLADVQSTLTGAYSVLNQFTRDPLQSPVLVYNIMSDECNGAGGTGDVECSAIGHLVSNKPALFDMAYSATYAGVARANSVIYSIDNFNWPSKEQRDQTLGEAYFLRGLYYLWGSQFFGNIPAYWQASAPTPCPQQDAETVIYPHILADFLSAYTLMPSNYTQMGDGHATKDAAAGYLARAYMFYEGFYKQVGELAKAGLDDDKKNIDLPSQEGATKQLSYDQVVAALDYVCGNKRYDLIKDYRLLWQYTNKYTAPDYAFVKDLAKDNRFWAGNGNQEEIFQIQFGNFGSWNGNVQMGFINQTSLYCSLRTGSDNNGRAASVPFGEGWGQGVFNSNMLDGWEAGDVRKKATILECDDRTEIGAFDYVSDASEETGLYNKKVIAVTSKECDFSSVATWWGIVRGSNTQSNGNSMQGDHFADLVLMRLADIYLMHSELTGTNTWMKEVRRRAGLNPDMAYSWDNIKRERLHEFMGEGLRFNDLRRWSGKNGGENCEAAKALQAQEGTKVFYVDHWSTMKHATSSWAKRYAATDGFLQMPEAQINIIANPNVLTQNPGWTAENTDKNISSSPVY